MGERFPFGRPEFVIEATDFEERCLWNEYGERIQWEQLNPGWWEEIGKVAHRPIAVTVSFARLDGRLVMFYEGCSELVDYKMVRRWVMKMAKPPQRDGRESHCNAPNFHLCLHALGIKLEARHG